MMECQPEVFQGVQLYKPMKHPDYRKIHRPFDQRLNKDQWEDDKPLTFDDLPDVVKEESPWLKDYCLYNLEYHSNNAHYLVGNSSYICKDHSLPSFGGEVVKAMQFEGNPVVEQTSDESIKENICFRYPLVRKCPSTSEPQQCERLVILLHGLNEFSFLKYMPWAYGTLIGSNVPTSVVLFPLTFSIKRADRQWANLEFKRRIMEHREKDSHNEKANRFNSIISERLEAHPERFFWGAMQSYWDIVDLVAQIRSEDNEKQHPHIAPDARIDFIGFSSGGYLALALLAVNHQGWFSDSRACLFATCVEMRNLGTSTIYTVDRKAENKLRKCYVEEFDTWPNERMRHWLDCHPEGRWMRNFGGRVQDRAQREERLRELAPRLLGITSPNDEVMPLDAMLNVLKGIRRDQWSTGVRVEELALGIHEHPFCLPDYELNKRGLVEPFNERYSAELDQFIDLIVGHLNQTLRD
jgi:hypothetical protein